MSRTESAKGRLTKAAFAFALCASVVLVAIAAAFGGELDTFGVYPSPRTIGGHEHRLHYSIGEGGAVRDAVLVFNKTNKPLKVSFQGLDATKDASGKISLFEGPPTQVGSWIHPEPSEVVLAPKGKATVNFSIARPAGGRPGVGALVVIALEKTSVTASGFDLNKRIALVVTVGDSRRGPSFSIEGVSLGVPLQIFPAKGDVQVALFNGSAETTPVHLVASIETLTGRVFDLPAVDLSMKAGEAKIVSLPWRGVPRTGGVFRATVQARWAHGKLSRPSGRRLVVPVWLVIVALAFEGLVIYRLRHR